MEFWYDFPASAQVYSFRIYKLFVNKTNVFLILKRKSFMHILGNKKYSCGWILFEIMVWLSGIDTIFLFCVKFFETKSQLFLYWKKKLSVYLDERILRSKFNVVVIGHCVELLSRESSLSLHCMSHFSRIEVYLKLKKVFYWTLNKKLKFADCSFFEKQVSGSL